jgi:hypothetical protein
MKLILIFGLFLSVIGLGFSQSNENEQVLDLLLNDWHKNAAQTNLESYFELLDSSFIFLGTAPGERWDKATFYSFCKPYFDTGRAWDFKPVNRHWYFSNQENVVWFEEDLDTWMLGCRGTGVFQKINGEWKLCHYNLTVLIENEKVEQFIDLRLQPILIEEKEQD